MLGVPRAKPGLRGVCEGYSPAVHLSESGRVRSWLQREEPHDRRPATPPYPPPDPVEPIRAASSGSLLLLGLGLTGAGLVLGGAGFAVLYLCRDGTGCYNNTTTTIGWVLAAPGIIPLVVGVAILYFGTGGGRRADLTPTEKAGQWAFSAMPLNGGGMISGAVRF